MLSSSRSATSCLLQVPIPLHALLPLSPPVKNWARWNGWFSQGRELWQSSASNSSSTLLAAWAECLFSLCSPLPSQSKIITASFSFCLHSPNSSLAFSVSPKFFWLVVYGTVVMAGECVGSFFSHSVSWYVCVWAGYGVNQNGLGWTGCVQYLYTVVFRRPPLMAHCISVCTCVCVCVLVFILYIRGGIDRGMRSEEKGTG